jgi:hypothetical protein
LKKYKNFSVLQHDCVGIGTGGEHFSFWSPLWLAIAGLDPASKSRHLASTLAIRPSISVSTAYTTARVCSV